MLSPQRKRPNYHPAHVILNDLLTLGCLELLLLLSVFVVLLLQQNPGSCIMCFKKKEEKEDEEAGKNLSSGAGGMVGWLKVFVNKLVAWVWFLELLAPWKGTKTSRVVL